jgi:hypothetical protein
MAMLNNPTTPSGNASIRGSESKPHGIRQMLRESADSCETNLML